MPKYYIVLACTLIGVASLFQLLGLGLVVPVLNGLVDEAQFEGITTAPVLGAMIRNLPFEATNQNVFIFMMILIFVAVLLENLSIFMGKFYATRVSQELTCNLRVKVFSRLLGLSKTFFDKQSLAEVNALMVSFIQSANRTTNHITILLIQGLFAFVFFALMVIISWQLTLCAIVLLPITHFVAGSISKKIKISAAKEVDDTVDISNQVDDVFGNIALVQLSNKETEENLKFSEYARSASANGASVRIRGCLVPSVIDVINGIGALLIVTVSVFLFFTSQTYSLGRLLVFFVALRRFTQTIQQISTVCVNIIAEIPSLEKIEWALNSEQTKIVDGDKEFTGVKDVIEYRDITFSYDPSVPVLDNINIDIPAKSVIAFVGPTGAGKTTIVNLLPRFYDPNAGDILIDGVSISEFELASLRNRIAIVSQSELLFNASIRWNITYGVKSITEEKFREAIRNAQLEDLINSLPEGENTIVGTKGSRLSGGEKQRIGIARAILKDPDILIMDEPTSALDAETEAKLDKAFEAVLPGRTVLIVAHRLATVKKADKIFFIDEGQIKEMGNFDQLLKDQDSKFYNYCRLQHLT